ncbi:protein-tyrosine phosphatase, putative [Entamoeba invadens IP1]|uniref:Protein-tyrosine phosphatase, putative n=1 Tax=Entamoeba invadens IP1 TaxID=370355 RepID=A0A0A1U1Z4_ENTIV|nr:protein-tyrosine phosphatase, putative [Entamoeba invadens IP1]ELP88076.1 protein-tyrosine phosphatase, putative [Entamoeba invadens IP1]|eukprot:XP_004254847.1 protein-tyrosine phosphatase, putative [Entamoeba invadens IP1]
MSTASPLEPNTFDWIEANTPQTSTNDFKTALLPENEVKNRYSNVLPNETTRVLVRKTDYINANHVFGNRYISCQAPLSNTTEDFYTMAWEQESGVVVMLTKFEEKEKSKASSYFPDTPGQMKRFGNFTVTCGAVLFGDPQTIGRMEMQARELIMENKTLGKGKRTLIHIHYTGWPDFGVPPNSLIFRDMIYIVLSCCGRYKGKALTGPPIIHCSAGLGRSGTFLGTLRFYQQYFNSLLKKPVPFVFNQKTTKAGELENRINAIDKPVSGIELRELLANVVFSMRSERKGMVQTAEQYEFLVANVGEFFQTVWGKMNGKKSELIEVVKPLMSDTTQEAIDPFIKKIKKKK